MGYYCKALAFQLKYFLSCVVTVFLDLITVNVTDILTINITKVSNLYREIAVRSQSND
jgi:hypothetical protein